MQTNLPWGGLVFSIHLPNLTRPCSLCSRWVDGITRWLPTLLPLFISMYGFNATQLEIIRLFTLPCAHSCTHKWEGLVWLIPIKAQFISNGSDQGIIELDRWWVRVVCLEHQVLFDNVLIINLVLKFLFLYKHSMNAYHKTFTQTISIGNCSFIDGD